MKFLVDECVEYSVVQFLREEGHDVRAVAEGPPFLSDKKILSDAYEEKRIVITTDKYFGTLVFKNAYASAGVCLLRLRTDAVKEKIRILGIVLEHFSGKLPGHFVVVKENSIRIRQL